MGSNTAIFLVKNIVTEFNENILGKLHCLEQLPRKGEIIETLSGLLATTDTNIMFVMKFFYIAPLPL